MEIEYVVQGDIISKIRVGKIEIPCNTQRKNLDGIEKLIKSLIELGVFSVVEKEKSFKELVMELVDNERKLIKALPTREWIPKSELDASLGLEGRQIAGVLANITRKARKHGLIDKQERLHDQKWENDENYYKLRPQFEGLKTCLIE